MYILGCHFGHDANISLIKDNKIICYFEKERHSRVKHAMGLDSNDIVAILDSYNLTIEDIDVVGITCTQKCPIIDWDNTLKISLRGKKITNLNVIDANQWIENLPKDFPYRRFFKWSNKNAKAGFLFSEHFYKSSLLKQVFSFTKDNNDLCQAQEILFSINNRSPKKAYYVGHHFAHAAYAFGMSSKPNALIITMDGATANGYIGGGVYFGKNNKIFPMYSHGFFGGGFYDNVAYSLSKNLDAGKLMGLSAYGDPCFFQKKYIGTINEMKKMVGGTEGHLVAEHFLKSIPMNQEIKSDDFWSADKLPNSNIANIASSTQKIFMKNVEYMVINAIDFAKKKKFHHHEIIFSGGCALNCPTNSYINSMFGPLFIPPAINDEGLSIGAAITFADNWEKPKNISPLIAYLGPKNKVEPFSYIQTHFSSKVIILSANSEAIKQLAQLLYDGNVAGFYFGRSEIGPRALGHRSIVASPLISKNHSKVNYIKNREEWRPFAPISTINSADKFFYNVKKDSYFMLFNAKAKTKDLPAVTHIDGTSRIQIATTDCGPIYDLLLSFGEISGGYEILLNTSFNDKNEPIVESIDDALNAFLKMDLDYLYLDGLLLKKCQTNH